MKRFRQNELTLIPEEAYDIMREITKKYSCFKGQNNLLYCERDMEKQFPQLLGNEIIRLNRRETPSTNWINWKENGITICVKQVRGVTGCKHLLVSDYFNIIFNQSVKPNPFHILQRR